MHERMQRYAPRRGPEKANHRSGGGIFHHFVNADFVSTGTTLKEEIVKKVELKVPTGKYVRTRPRVPHGINRESGLP